MARNYEEYEIVIDVNQPLSLEDLDEKLPPLEPINLTPIEHREQSLTDAGWIDDDLLNQDIELGLEQEMPMLENFYESAKDMEARREREETEKAKQPRVKREPVHLEQRRPRFSESNGNEPSKDTKGGDSKDAPGNKVSVDEEPGATGVAGADHTNDKSHDRDSQSTDTEKKPSDSAPTEVSEQNQKGKLEETNANDKPKPSADDKKIAKPKGGWNDVRDIMLMRFDSKPE